VSNSNSAGNQSSKRPTIVGMSIIQLEKKKKKWCIYEKKGDINVIKARSGLAKKNKCSNDPLRRQRNSCGSRSAKTSLQKKRTREKPSKVVAFRWYFKKGASKKKGDQGGNSKVRETKSGGD